MESMGSVLFRQSHKATCELCVEDIMGAVFHMMLGGTGSQLFNDATYLDGVTQYHSVTGRAAINATQRRMFR